MRCAKCDVQMVKMKTVFLYLGHEVTEDVPRCPKCGKAFIPESLVKGKINDVEVLLEEK